MYRVEKKSNEIQAVATSEIWKAHREQSKAEIQSW